MRRGPSEKSPHRLLVEGSDDKWSVINLMTRHGVEWERDADRLPFVKDMGSIDELLIALPTALKSYRRVGIVVDADLDAAAVWARIEGRLRGHHLALPSAPELNGVVVPGIQTESRFGAWVMPDNLSPGILEHFLATLIPRGDATWPFAEECTRKAVELGAPLPAKDSLKGQLFAWLAWRKEPGLPFGTALTASVLRHDSPEAMRFVSWFRRVFLDEE